MREQVVGLGLCLCLGLLVACGQKPSGQPDPSCGDGVTDPGEECDWGIANSDAPDAVCRTDCRVRRCGDAIVDSHEQCDLGELNGDGDGTSCRSDCSLPGCGDGVVATGEECDDGSANSDTQPDACRTDCTTARCGDGAVDTGEECDFGLDNSDTAPNACRTSCVLPRCGDSVTDAGEECDLGATNSDTIANRCREDCRDPWCGDGVVDDLHGESCDEAAANTQQPDGTCRTDCLPQRCGDSVADSGEECDEGTANSDITPDACRTDCVLAICGDGVVDLQAGEECDDGSGNSDTEPDACRSDCHHPVCGDGVTDVNYGEGCDLGVANSDLPDAACRSDCRPARCGDAILDSGEVCDLGAANSDAPDATCRSDCTAQRCGDAILDSGEACDDGPGNTNQPNAGCRTSCQLPGCGDAILDDALGEQCDLGGANSDAPDAACRLDCTPLRCGDSIVDTGEECDLGASNVNGLTSACRTDCLTTGSIPQPWDLTKLIEDPVRPQLYGITDTYPTELVVIDTEERVEATRINLGLMSQDIAIASNGSVLVVGNNHTNAPILVFQPDTMDLSQELFVGWPARLDVTASQDIYYSLNWVGGDVDRVSIPGGAATDQDVPWATCQYGGGVTFGPDDQFLYLAGCQTSGSHLWKYGVFSQSLVDKTVSYNHYGYYEPPCWVYVSPSGNHAYYAFNQFDAQDLRFRHGPFYERTFVEDQAGTVSVGEYGISDAETWEWVKEFPDYVSAAAFSHQDRRLWYYSPDTGELHYSHVADHLVGVTLAQRDRAPKPMTSYGITKLVHDPIRPKLYGLATEQNVVVAIDASTLQATHEYMAGFAPRVADIDPTGTYLYVGFAYTSGVARFTLDPFAFDGWVVTDDTVISVAALTNDRVAVSSGWSWRGPEVYHSLTGQRILEWDFAAADPTSARMFKLGDGHELFIDYGPMRVGFANDQWSLIDTGGGVTAAGGAKTFLSTPDGNSLFLGFAKLDGHDLSQLQGTYGDYFLTASPDNSLLFSSTRVWDVATLRQVGTLPVIGYAQAMNPLGTILYVFTHFRELVAVDVTQYAPLPPLTGCGDGVVDPGEECDDGNTQAWDGCDDCLRQEFRLYLSGEHPEEGKIRLRSNGEGVLAWMAERPTNDGYGVYYTRLDDTGGTSSMIQGNQAVLLTAQKFGVALADDGRVVVGWQGTHPPNIEPFIRRFDANDQALSSDTLVPVDTVFDHAFSDVAVGPAGNGVVAFDHDHDDSTVAYCRSGVFGRRLSTSMSPTGGDFRMNTTTFDNQWWAKLATDANGNFVAVWTHTTSEAGGGNILYGQKFTSGGTAVGPELVLHSSTEGRQHHPHVAMAADGRFAVTWVQWADPPPGPYRVWARIYDVTGAPLGPEFLVNQGLEGDHKEPQIGITDTGRVVVAFVRVKYEPLAGGMILRWFDAAGQPEGPEQIVSRELGWRYHPSLAVLGDGRTMLTWRFTPDNTSEIFLVGQRWDAAGNVIGRDPW